MPRLHYNLDTHPSPACWLQPGHDAAQYRYEKYKSWSMLVWNQSHKSSEPILDLMIMTFVKAPSIQSDHLTCSSGLKLQPSFTVYFTKCQKKKFVLSGRFKTGAASFVRSASSFFSESFYWWLKRLLSKTFTSSICPAVLVVAMRIDFLKSFT